MSEHKWRIVYDSPTTCHIYVGDKDIAGDVVAYEVTGNAGERPCLVLYVAPGLLEIEGVGTALAYMAYGEAVSTEAADGRGHG